VAIFSGQKIPGTSQRIWVTRTAGIFGKNGLEFPT
jgi:hypothetical protein